MFIEELVFCLLGGQMYCFQSCEGEDQLAALALHPNLRLPEQQREGNRHRAFEGR